MFSANSCGNTWLLVCLVNLGRFFEGRGSEFPQLQSKIKTKALKRSNLSYKMSVLIVV